MFYPAVIVIHVAVLCQLSSAQNIPRQVWHSKDHYPDPMKNPVTCNRPGPSYICDPDRIIVPYEADQLNTLLVNTLNETRCPCSRYSCSRYPEGYKIGIALTKQIRADSDFRSRSDDDRDETSRKNEWLLNQGMLFARTVMEKWDLGRCSEDVLIFYSMNEGILYTTTGEVARMKLNHTVINAIMMNARGDFGPGGNVFRGLLKIVKEYRSVFFGAYTQTGRPKASEIRNAGVGLTQDWTGVHRAASLVASLFVLILTYLAS